MAMSVAFNTLSYAKRMESVGFSRQQAEAMADERSQLFEEQAKVADVRAVTKSDIETLRLPTKADIIELKNEIAKVRIEIELSKRDIIITTGSTLAIVVGILLATMGFFYKHS